MNRRIQPHPNTDPRWYGGVRLNKRLVSMHISLLKLMKVINWQHARKLKQVSEDYQNIRYHIIARIVLIELPSLGYEPTSLKRLKPKHFRALLRLWERKGLKGGTMQNKMAAMRAVCRALKKLDCIPDDPAQILDDPSRYRAVTVAREDKSFSANNVDIVEVVDAVCAKDPRVALILVFQATYGLRTKEAIMLRPHEAHQGDHLLVTYGTKGGRPRTIPLYDFDADYSDEHKAVVLWNLRENKLRLQVIELAMNLIPPGSSIIPVEYTLKTYRRYVRYVMEKYGGLTKKRRGVTPHGLRHEYLLLRAATASQAISPLRRAGELAREDVIRERVGRQVAALDAGHHDLRTTAAYYGPTTERAPRGAVREIARSMKGAVATPIIQRDHDGRFVGGEGRKIVVLDQPPSPDD